MAPQLHKEHTEPCSYCNYRVFHGASGQTRTDDLRITNALLYRLSYRSINPGSHELPEQSSFYYIPHRLVKKINTIKKRPQEKS